MRSLFTRARRVTPEEFRTPSFQRWLLRFGGRTFALPGEWLAAILLRRRRKRTHARREEVLLYRWAASDLDATARVAVARKLLPALPRQSEARTPPGHRDHG